jgi:hypothetical protein
MLENDEQCGKDWVQRMTHHNEEILIEQSRNICRVKLDNPIIEIIDCNYFHTVCMSCTGFYFGSYLIDNFGRVIDHIP